MLKKLRYFYIAWVLLFYSCDKTPLEFYDGMGKRPKYIALDELKNIKSLPPEDITASGTIFLKNNLFFILEQRKGIHVYDISDSLNTVNLVFLNIPAITDFTVSGKYLYADSWTDLVTIDISDLQRIKEVGRSENVLNPVLYPLLYDGIFECVDASKGAVIDWEDAQLIDAKCITSN
jgi:LVIVD repeat